MKEKVKSDILSVANRIKFVLKYISVIIKPSLKNIAVIVICSLAVYAFYETAEDFFSGIYYIAINLFYVLMLVVCLASVAANTYRTGKRHLLFSDGPTERFRYLNGLLIGVITAAPLIVFCIVENAKGFTYYASDAFADLVRLFLYLYAFVFSEYPVVDFSYPLFMLLSLVPIAACAFSYAAPKAVGELRERKRKKEEAA